MKHGNTISSTDVIKEIKELQSNLEDALTANFEAAQEEAAEEISTLKEILEGAYDAEYAQDYKYYCDGVAHPVSYGDWREQYQVPSFEDWLELVNTRQLFGLKIEELEKLMSDHEDAELELDLDDIGWLKDLAASLAEVDYSEVEDLISLLEAQEEAEGYNSDWSSGCELIASHYFPKWVREYAEDTSGIDFSVWPCDNIDWEQAAKDLEPDYNEIDLNGQTYYIRCT